MHVRRPLVGLVICFLLGTWCGLAWSVSFFYPFIAAWILLLLGLLPAARVRLPALFLAVVCTGWSAAGLRTGGFNACVAELPAGARVEIVGMVSSDPAVERSATTNWQTWQFEVRTEELRDGTNAPGKPFQGRVMVRWHAPSKGKAPRYGDRWEIPGILRAGSRSRCFLNGNWSASEFRSGGHGSRFIEWCYAERKAAAKYLAAGIEDFPDQVALLKALVLGYRQTLPKDIEQAFVLTGTLHIFAISGSHVAMIALIITFVLTALKISRVHWILFLGPLLVVYTVATGAEASAVRACVMGIIYFLAPLLRRKADALSALAFAALAIVAASPSQLFDVGFILSFVVVAGLIVLYPVFMRPMERLLRRDDLAPDPEIVEDQRFRKRMKRVELLREAARSIASLFAMSCAAWLASTPLTAYFFGRFIPIALLSNLLVVPLAFLVVLAGCLSLVLGSCLALFADIFNHANLALVSVMVGSMKLAERMPYGSIEVSKPPLWLVWAWYALLIAGIVLAASQKRRKTA